MHQRNQNFNWKRVHLWRFERANANNNDKGATQQQQQMRRANAHNDNLKTDQCRRS